MSGLPVARVIVFAVDMAKMTAFYEDVLGLERVVGDDDPTEFVSLRSGPIQLSLHRVPDRFARDIEIADPPEPRHGTPLKVAFGVDDVAATRTALESRGARMDPVRVFGELHLCDGVDPEGNIFQITNRIG